MSYLYYTVLCIQISNNIDFSSTLICINNYSSTIILYLKLYAFSKHFFTIASKERRAPMSEKERMNKGMTGEISDVRRSKGELCVEWRIPQFLHLSCGFSDCYDSPCFHFSDRRWHFRVSPNSGSSGSVDISICFGRGDDDDWFPLSGGDDREDDSPKTVDVWAGVRGADGSVEKRTEKELVFVAYDSRWLVDFCSRSELAEQKQRLMPDGALTIVCEIKIPESDEEDSTQKEDKEASDDEVPVDDEKSSGLFPSLPKVFIVPIKPMKELFVSREQTHVTVRVKDAEFRVHRGILPFVIEHDTVTNEIRIDDCEPDIFGEYLQYLHTGSVPSLSERTVFDLYRLADMYRAVDLKLLCSEHMRNTLSVRTFCDTLKLSLTHGDGDLLRRVIDFATRNLPSIIRSPEWQNFICEHPREANAFRHVVKFKSKNK